MTRIKAHKGTPHVGNSHVESCMAGTLKRRWVLPMAMAAGFFAYGGTITWVG